MRIYRFLLFVCMVGTTLVPVCVSAQQNRSQATQSDSRALVLLQKAISAAGGADAIRSIKDFTAKGKITFYWTSQGVSGPVEIQGRGLDQVRMDSHLPDGMHSLVLSHGKGEMRAPQVTRKVPAPNASRAGLVFFPLPAIVAAMDDPMTVISYQGSEDIGGRQTYKIEIQKGLANRFQQVEKLKRLKSF